MLLQGSTEDNDVIQVPRSAEVALASGALRPPVIYFQIGRVPPARQGMLCPSSSALVSYDPPLASWQASLCFPRVHVAELSLPYYNRRHEVCRTK